MPLSADGWFDDGFTATRVLRRVSTVGRTSFDANMWGAVQPETAIPTGMAFESKSTRRVREVERRIQPRHTLRENPESEDVDRMMAWESRNVSRVPHDPLPANQGGASDIAGIFPLPVWVQDPNTFAAPFVGPARYRKFSDSRTTEPWEFKLVIVFETHATQPTREARLAIQPEHSEPDATTIEDTKHLGFAKSFFCQPPRRVKGGTVSQDSVLRESILDGEKILAMGWSSFSCHPTTHARPLPPIHTSEVLEQSPLPFPWTESTFTHPTRHDRHPGTVNSDPPWAAVNVVIVSGPYTLVDGQIHCAGASAGDVTED